MITLVVLLRGSRLARAVERQLADRATFLERALRESAAGEVTTHHELALVRRTLRRVRAAGGQ